MINLDADATEMVNRKLKYYVEKGIKIEQGTRPTEAFIKTYANFFPRPLWYIWEKIGFACLDNGGFWLVNPDDYADLLDEILKPTPFYAHDDWYVFGRTAFGNLKVSGRHTNSSLKIDMDYIRIFPWIKDDYQLSQKDYAISLTTFLDTNGMRDKKTFDIPDRKNNYLFDRCLASYGKLKEDEIYTFVPALALGGTNELKNIQRVNIFEHINFIRQLQPFKIMMDINRTVDNMGITPESAAAFVATQNKPSSPPSKYDTANILQENKPATVAVYYQDLMTKKLIYLNTGDIAPSYPTPAHLSKSKSYVWHKLTEYGLSLIPQERLDQVKK
ncbi:MAG: DUF1851 domain-containing protein [Moraxella sp.]|nr:DUF1851 domain-containing protein [Moraxella sp.]